MKTMKSNNKVKAVAAICFSFLISAGILFMPFTGTVWAEDGEDSDKGAPDKLYFLLQSQSASGVEDADPEEGTHVHADPATFEKNFDLSWEQKKMTIQDMEKIVSETITPDMSDLEKYYRLAIAANKSVTYDWEFWNGRYVFEYYSHQWDSYGCLNERSVCAGIAIFYSQLCHAADLPCWFVRMDPDSLDHTICFIPDINGNAYYIDVTENLFFMSEDANPFQPIDKAFSHITKEYTDVTDCTDNTFNYLGEDGESLQTVGIKECYDVPYEDWFKEYALHENTDKTFPTKYVEKGSGLRANEEGHRHVSYYDYRSNFVEPEHKQVWLLDDFYRNPEETEAKIKNKEFDDQLLNVTGIKKNYDCDSEAELEAEIAKDISENKISVEYFPTYNGEAVVAESAGLEAGTDYEITCTDFNADEKTAAVTVTGKGDYKGSYQISVKLNSAVVAQAPAPKKGLKYSGATQKLIEEGVAEGGVMQYALGTKNEPTEEFSTAVPEVTNAGKYYVWYKVEGTDGHEDCAATLMKPAVSIAPISVSVIVDDEMKIATGQTAVISPKLDNAKLRAKFKFESEDESVATVDEKGVVTGVSGGITTIFVEAVLEGDSTNFEVDSYYTVTVQVQEPRDITETKVRFNKSSFTYNGKVQKPEIMTVKGWKLEAGTDYTVKWSNAKSKKPGTYKVIVTGKGMYTGWTDATYTIKKAANPMTLKAKTVTLKYKELKKKAKTVKQAKAFTVSKAQGKRTYKLVSAKKGSKSFKRKFKVDRKTGKIKVKKGLKKGTYKVKVRVKANGNANYKASSWKAVTVKVKVK